jgi:hypothetical protein
MIDRLDEAGFITAGSTDRDERYPERTTYHLTDAGRAASRQWLAEMISTSRNEFPEFPAALSFLMLLTPQKAQSLLDQRRDDLARRIGELDAGLAGQDDGEKVPRWALLDEDYLRAVTDAELRWVTGTIDALRDGSLAWSRDELPPSE